MSSEFSCTLDGYVEKTNKLIELSLVGFAFAKENYGPLLNEKPAKSVQYAWDGLVRARSWAGFAVAALYYFGLVFGYADLMCEYSSYGYMLALNWLY